LLSQMRVKSSSDYVGYIRRLLGASPSAEKFAPEPFEGYDFQLFDDVGEMKDEIHRRNEETGLSRLVAGFAWPWISKNDKNAFDIDVHGHLFRWNSTQTDWIASPGSLQEVGSIHTVQGYDLNYAGVIIGPDLRFDPIGHRLFVERDSYFDKKGKENNAVSGKVYSDDDLLRFIGNIYAVLMTRGIRGTYVYAVDPGLKNYLQQFIPSH